jgi:hypothetical protein
MDALALLKQRRDEYQAELDKRTADLYAMQGALQAVTELIAELEKEPDENTNPA